MTRLTCELCRYCTRIVYSRGKQGFGHDVQKRLHVQVTVHRDKLRIKQPTRCINAQHLFCHKTLHVSGIFCAHHQELSIVRTAIGTFHAGYVTTS